MSVSIFGTDGIRGLYGTGMVTENGFELIGQALACWLEDEFKDHQSSLVCVGHDGRYSWEPLYRGLVSGLSRGSIRVYMLGLMPTPGVSFSVVKSKANLGIMITASHNHYSDNGIKLVDSDGKKLSDEAISRIEDRINQVRSKKAVCVQKSCLNIEDKSNQMTQQYIDHCRACVSPEDKAHLAGLKVVVDCAHGAMQVIAPTVWKQLAGKAVLIHDSTDGTNINDRAGCLSPKVLCQRVQFEEADYGIAYDGDGDRLLLVDKLGSAISAEDILFTLAKYTEYASSGVVTTVMSNNGFIKALQQINIKHFSTTVGDKHVLNEMETQGSRLGGEESGHLIIRDYMSGSDALIVSIISVLLLAKKYPKSIYKREWKPWHTLKYHYNTSQFSSKHVRIVTSRIRHSIQQFSYCEALIRPSGTEPVIRVFLQSQDEHRLYQLKTHIDQVFNLSTRGVRDIDA